jgi:hypothetical protein
LQNNRTNMLVASILASRSKERRVGNNATPKDGLEVPELQAGGNCSQDGKS